MANPDECEDPYAQYDDPIYRQAATEAWVTTRMERDKSLLTLSTSGIGLLITLVTTIGVKSNLEAFFFAMASLFFALTIGFALYILDKNADYLEATITDDGRDETKLENKLDWLDLCVVGAFGVAIVFSIAIGITAALTH